MKNKIQFVHHAQASTPCEILSYLHCAKCIAEKPDSISPKDWARTQTGWTKKGFQVACTRHNCNITNVEVRQNPDLWEPISTAPKDGTTVLLYGEDRMAIGHFDDSPRLGNYPAWRWGLTYEPTH